MISGWVLFRPCSCGGSHCPVYFLALIKNFVFVPKKMGNAMSGGTLRCEYFPFLFISHSYVAGSWTDTLYHVSEMAFAS